MGFWEVSGRFLWGFWDDGFCVGISCGTFGVGISCGQRKSNFVFGYKYFVWAFRVGINVGISVGICVGICVG